MYIWKHFFVIVLGRIKRLHYGKSNTLSKHAINLYRQIIRSSYLTHADSRYFNEVSILRSNLLLSLLKEIIGVYQQSTSWFGVLLCGNSNGQIIAERLAALKEKMLETMKLNDFAYRCLNYEFQEVTNFSNILRNERSLLSQKLKVLLDMLQNWQNFISVRVLVDIENGQLRTTTPYFLDLQERIGNEIYNLTDIRTRMQQAESRGFFGPSILDHILNIGFYYSFKCAYEDEEESNIEECKESKSRRNLIFKDSSNKSIPVLYSASNLRGSRGMPNQYLTSIQLIYSQNNSLNLSYKHLLRKLKFDLSKLEVLIEDHNNVTTSVQLFKTSMKNLLKKFRLNRKNDKNEDDIHIPIPIPSDNLPEESTDLRASDHIIQISDVVEVQESNASSLNEDQQTVQTGPYTSKHQLILHELQLCGQSENLSREQSNEEDNKWIEDNRDAVDVLATLPNLAEEIIINPIDQNELDTRRQPENLLSRVSSNEENKKTKQVNRDDVDVLASLPDLSEETFLNPVVQNDFIENINTPTLVDDIRQIIDIALTDEIFYKTFSVNLDENVLGDITLQQSLLDTVARQSRELEEAKKELQLDSGQDVVPEPVEGIAAAEIQTVELEEQAERIESDE